MAMLPEQELECRQTGVSAYAMQHLLCYATSHWPQVALPPCLDIFASGLQ